MRFFAKGDAVLKWQDAQIGSPCNGGICYNIAHNSFAFIALLAHLEFVRECALFL